MVWVWNDGTVQIWNGDIILYVLFSSLKKWVCNKQMKTEGGFQVRDIHVAHHRGSCIMVTSCKHALGAWYNPLSIWYRVQSFVQGTVFL